MNLKNIIPLYTLLRCYNRIEGGNKKLKKKTVMKLSKERQGCLLLIITIIAIITFIPVTEYILNYLTSKL